MADQLNFLKELKNRFAKLIPLAGSSFVFESGDKLCRVYICYSKAHKGQQPVYSIIKAYLKQLEGFNSVLCFRWDPQTEPLFIPYERFKEIYSALKPAAGDQVNLEIYPGADETEMYIAGAGRCNVSDFLGWASLDRLIRK